MDDERFQLDPNLAQRYDSEAASTSLAPDRLFDRQWCRQLLKQVLERLESDYAEARKLPIFKELHPILMAGGSLRGHDPAAIAARLDMSEAALRAALSRMLRHYRRLLEAEIRETVDSAEAVDAEITHLMAAMAPN